MISINKITISNYRSYKNVQNKIIDLKKLNMFTGKNNSGKTNILRAIDLFFNPENYNPSIDMNMVKQLTGGASQHPNIKVEVKDDEIERGTTKTYTIVLNLNKAKDRYSITGKNPPESLKSSKEIENYLEKKFKCIYLSTTDEDISSQAYTIVNDMILNYYKKKNKAVKKTVEEFESKYKELLGTFRSNISELEKDLGMQFELFKKNDIDISPKLKIENNTTISNFLLDNIKLELDDAYSQIIKAKGAGIQRTSLILLSFFLLSEIYGNVNKIILLDEPEAFLYPLLTTGLKDTIENYSAQSNNSQVFLTSHSREFLTEINNPNYSFYNVDQESETKIYERSKNENDINKYSIISLFDAKTKYEVLKNYGLLDNIDDHETVIICEGKTDRNYIVKILEDKEFRPQIRYEKYSDYLENGEYINGEKLNYDFIPSGAQAVVPLLIFLERVSAVHRKVFIVLDGDSEGEKVGKAIKESEYKNLEIKKFIIDTNQEIEDKVYTKEDFIERVISISPEIESMKEQFSNVINSCNDGESFISKTEGFIRLYSLNQNIYNLKHKLSIDLDNYNIQKDWIISELEEFFY